LSPGLSECPLGRVQGIARRRLSLRGAGTLVIVELVGSVGQMQLSAVSGSAEADVADLPIQGAVAEQEALLGGQSLCLMDGQGVSVLDGAAAQVARRHDDLTWTCAEGDGPGVRGDVGDDTSLAVDQTVEVGVAPGNDEVADLEVALTAGR
jgi:hypothetical protein